MKKIFLLLFILMSLTTFSQVNVVGYIQTNGVANYPTHIDSMGKGGYMVARDTTERNNIPCLRRKKGMAVYSQAQDKLYILKDSCDNIWTEFTSGNGGSGIIKSNAFGSFYDSTTQTIASTTTAYPIRIAKTDTAYGFHITNNQIIADSAGLYNLQWSGQFQNTDNAENDVSVWIKKNGVNVVGSTGFIAVPKTRASIYGHTIASWNYIVTMNVGDSIVFYWQATNTGVSLQYYPQQTSPTRPSTASVLATITPIFAGTIIGNGGGGSASQTLQQVLDYNHSLLNGVNTQGTQAGAYSSGSDVNAFGTQSAYVNSGNNVNAFGSTSANGNSGDNVNAFGNDAGANNIYSNVTLFGERASADSTNQMVFSLIKVGDNSNKNARIDFNCLTNDRKYIFPDFDGYVMIANEPITIDTQLDTIYTITKPGNYRIINNYDDKAVSTLFLPNPSEYCNTIGQRLIITNVVDNTKFYNNILLDQTYPIYYRGSNIPITKIAPGETAEFYTDGNSWIRLTALPNPSVVINMYANGDYYIPIGGTYFIYPDGGNNMYFPPPCDADGEKITIINKSTIPQNIVTGNKNCATASIEKIDGGVIYSVGSLQAMTFVASNGIWMRIAFEQ